ARRPRAGDERADLVECVLGYVQHQVPRAARLDDAAEHSDEVDLRTWGPDQDRLGLEQLYDRAQPVRAQRAAAGDEIDDRIGESEPRCELDRAVDVDELDRLGEEGARKPREARRDAGAGEILE